MKVQICSAEDVINLDDQEATELQRDFSRNLDRLRFRQFSCFHIYTYSVDWYILLGIKTP